MKRVFLIATFVAGLSVIQGCGPKSAEPVVQDEKAKEIQKKANESRANTESPSGRGRSGGRESFKR